MPVFPHASINTFSKNVVEILSIVYVNNNQTLPLLYLLLLLLVSLISLYVVMCHIFHFE